MSVLSKKVKEYCLSKLSDPEISSHIPIHYVSHIQNLAKEKGISVPSAREIQSVRNGRVFNDVIVDLFVELAENNRNFYKKRRGN